jgi:inner membrane protein
MPTPIGHALAGLAVAGLVRRGAVPVPASHVGVLIFCAVAPDLDLALRFVDGVNHHRGATHSIAAAGLAGMAGIVLGRLSPGRFPGGLAMAAAWFSHVVLDFLGVDTSPPSGEMALWPFSESFFVSPVAVFYDVRRAFSPSAIEHNIIAAVAELLVMVPIAMLAWGIPFFPKKERSQ